MASPAQDGSAAQPAAERRPPRKVTPAYLDRAALAYLERFASSAENLRRVLARKVQRRCRLRGEDPAEFQALVEDVVRRAAAGGLVDDRRYAEGRVASLRRRGSSTRLIGAKLSAKGVAREVIEGALRDDRDEEAAAWTFARRRRLGPYRARDRAAFREKDLAAMARGGFRFDLARRVVDGEPGEG
jgi:regulatory protein